MTPFQVYLMLQADSLIAVFILLGIVGAGMWVITTLIRTCDHKRGYEEAGEFERRKALQKWLCRLSAPFAFLLLPAAFMPSTKTIAAMYVVPKVTSPAALNTLSSGGRQLYDAALGALNRIGAKDTPASNK